MEYRTTSAAPRHEGEAPWSHAIPDDQWRIFAEVLETMRADGISFALGGAFAVAHYTGQWRNTKDLDIYLRPDQREKAISILDALHFEDYFSTLPYDRWWIYRGVREETITDLIWALANKIAVVDEDWLHYAERSTVRELDVAIIPAEELLWAKLYVLQRGRCDWPDLLNLLYFTGPTLQWDRLLRRVGEDGRLLAGLLAVFSWMCPGVAHRVPREVWNTLGLRQPEPAPYIDERCVHLVESRPWFAALQQR